VWDTTLPAWNGFTAPTAKTDRPSTAGFAFAWNAATDTSGIAGYEYQLQSLAIASPDTCPTFSAASGNGTSITATTVTTGALADGNCHRLAVRAFDNAGNPSAYNYSQPLLIDATAPPTAPSLADNATSIVGALRSGSTIFFRPSVASTIQITSTATQDPQSGIASSTFGALSAPTGWTYTPGVVSGNPAAKSLTWSASAAATSLSVTALNGAGTPSSSTTLQFTPDSTGPLADFTTPDEAANLTQTGTSLTVTWQEPSDPTGIATRTIAQRSATPVSGACTGVSWGSFGAPVTTSAGSFNATGLTTNTCYSWQVSLTDGVGNLRSAISGTVLVSPGTPGQPSVSAAPGVAIYQAAANGPVFFRPNGNPAIALSATSTPPAGGTIGSIRFENLTPATGWTPNPVLPNTDSSSPYTQTLTASSTAGSATILVTAKSGTGVDSQPTTLTLTADSAGPVLDWQTPNEGTLTPQTTTSLTISWTSSDAGSGIATTTVTQETGAVVTPGTCNGVSWSANGTVPGTSPQIVSGLLNNNCYRWTLTVVDQVGNSASVVSGSVLENLPPATDFVSPDEGTTVAQAASTTAVSWMESGTVATRSLQQQRGSIVTAGTCAGVSWTPDGSARPDLSPVSITGLLDGSCYRWIQTVSDGQGHQSVATSGSILVDSTLPAVAFTAPTVDGRQSSTTVVVSWTETDGGAGFGSRAWKRQELFAPGDGTCLGFDWFDDTVEASTASPQTQTGLFSGRCYRWTVALTDAVGNTVWATSATVLIDSVAPTADFTTPNESTTTATGTGGSTIAWTEADATAGLQSRSLQRQKSTVSGGACSATWTSDGTATTAPSPVVSTGLVANTCYRWVMTLTDRAGNSFQRTSGTLQNSVAVVASPFATGTAFETETLTALTTLASVTQVDFLVDGAIVASDNTSPYSATYSTTGLSDGTHQVQVKVTQTGGATTTSPASSVTVANSLNSTGRIASDYAAGALSLDSFVMDGVLSLLAPHALPARLEGSAAPTADLGAYLQYWGQLQQSTRDALVAFGNQPFRMDLYQPTHDIGQAEPGLTDCNHQDVSQPYHGMGGYTRWWCETLTTHFDLIYVAGSANTTTTIDRTDTTPHNQIADSVEQAGAALEAAYKLYSDPVALGGLGYDQPVSGGNRIKVSFNANGASSNLTDFSSHVFIDPSNFQRLLDYAAPHETFHVFQYGYKSPTDFGFPERDFWYESTAQWASRKYVDAHPSASLDWAIGDVSYMNTPQFEPSAETLNGQPLIYNPIFGWGNNDQRRYGSWVFAAQLETQFPSANIIRRTWELIRNGETAKQSIADAVNAQPSGSIPTFMQTYAMGAGQMTLADAVSRNKLSVDLDQSTIPMGDIRFTGHDDLGPARPARQKPDVLNVTTGASNTVSVGELGMAFVDLKPTLPPQTNGILTVRVERPDIRIQARLVTYRLLNGDPLQGRVVCASSDFVFSHGEASVDATIDQTCFFATLEIVRSGPPVEILPFGILATPVKWNASVGTGILFNGSVEIGMNDTGNLIVPGGTPSAGTGDEEIGLRLIDTHAGVAYDGISPDCNCEGWGVSDGTDAAYAEKSDFSSPHGLTVRSFTTDGTSVTSDVDAAGIFRVTHKVEIMPTSSSLFQITVNITNSTLLPRHLLYRRAMDWDVEPTAFKEYVTIGNFGTVPGSLVYDSNDGFASVNPLDPRTDRGATGFFVDYAGDHQLGTDDQGAMFDWDFGTLLPGQTKTFYLYYGAAPSEATAMAALQAAGVQVYSLGQPSNPGGPNYGQPVTFMFGFKEG
jgi:hypothetical protein